MRLIREESPKEVEQYAHIKPAPIFGSLRCFALCPGTRRTCTLAKGHSGPHIAHGLLKKVMAVWDEQGFDIGAAEDAHVQRPANVQAASEAVLEVFKSRSSWRKLPSDFLNTLANKLNSVEKATEFAQLCEKTGILKNNIISLVDLSGSDPDFAVGGVATTLTSYANTMGNLRQFNEARRALELALLLKPRHVPAWSSMALVAFNMEDCRTAVSWADKVLAFKPDPNRKDPWERSLAESMTTEGEKLAAESLGEPEMISTWKQLQEQMKAIKDACRR